MALGKEPFWNVLRSRSTSAMWRPVVRFIEIKRVFPFLPGLMIGKFDPLRFPPAQRVGDLTEAE